MHDMVCESVTDREALFSCPDCGRRVVVGKGVAKLVVIDRGDFTARHTGSTGGTVIDGVAAR